MRYQPYAGRAWTVAGPCRHQHGHPHATFFVDDLDVALVAELGPKLSMTDFFRNARISIAQLKDGG